MSLAILCSGQGAQHAGMLDMLAGHPAAVEVIKAGEAVLGFNLRDVLGKSRYLTLQFCDLQVDRLQPRDELEIGGHR